MITEESTDPTKLLIQVNDILDGKSAKDCMDVLTFCIAAFVATHVYEDKQNLAIRNIIKQIREIVKALNESEGHSLQ